jgi:hypothetical protein
VIVGLGAKGFLTKAIQLKGLSTKIIIAYELQHLCSFNSIEVV